MHIFFEGKKSCTVYMSKQNMKLLLIQVGIIKVTISDIKVRLQFGWN